MNFRKTARSTRTRRRPFLVWTLSVALLSSFLVVAAPAAAPAEALSGSDFNAGYIISDANFYTRDAMSEAQIQAFLNAKIGTCLNSYCLNVLRVDTPTTTLSFGTCSTYLGEANESAARVIYKVQQACTISAKVILATLHKEQGLVTKNAPTAQNLRAAMGQGCPDTAQCDSAFYGFFNQVLSGARQLAWYGNPAGSHTSIKVGQVNAVRFHPSAACGSSGVVIHNRATASLYYYTPYQPNGAALGNLDGTGDGCSSYGNRNFWVNYNSWFGSSTGLPNPRGDINSVTAVPGGASILGWAFDANSPDPIQTHVYVNDVYHSTVAANQPRPDVQASYPTQGADHGFNDILTLPVGVKSICIYAINVGPGINTLIGCRSVTVPAALNNPVGVLQPIVVSPGSIDVVGWTFDADTTAPIRAEVRINGDVYFAITADVSRPDVLARHPKQGPNHGYLATLPADEGSNTVCVYGINVGPGANSLIGCSTVNVPAPDSDPVGVLQPVTVAAGVIGITGWTFDADTKDAIRADVWVNGRWSTTLTADGARSDVQTRYPNQGPNHGFSASIPVPAGANTVCVFGINDLAGGSNTELGCSTVTVSAGISDPVGVLQPVTVSAGKLGVVGWTFDGDTKNPIRADVEINGKSVATLTADLARADVQARYPNQGPNHGYSALIPVAPGANTVCVRGINDVAGGVNPELGCSTVTVPAVGSTPAAFANPVGVLQPVTVAARSIGITGWTFDADTKDPIRADVWINGRWATTLTANGPRADVQVRYPNQGPNHGFSASVPTPAGSNTVCVYGINDVTGGPNPQLGCSTVNVPENVMAPAVNNPVGVLQPVTVSSGAIGVAGWTFDADTKDPIRADIWINGRWVKTLTADGLRGDVQARYPNQGANHGFSSSVPTVTGSNSICLYGINNVPSGVNTLLGCTTVTVPG